MPVFPCCLRREGRPHGHLAARRRDRRPDQASRTAGHDLRAEAHPVELLSLSGQLGAHVRATVSSFGPILLGKVLDPEQDASRSRKRLRSRRLRQSKGRDVQGRRRPRRRRAGHRRGVRESHAHDRRRATHAPDCLRRPLRQEMARSYRPHVRRTSASAASRSFQNVFVRSTSSGPPSQSTCRWTDGSSRRPRGEGPEVRREVHRGPTMARNGRRVR